MTNWSDIFITVLVLILIFFLAYSAIRKQGIGDTITELREAFVGKASDVSDIIKYQ